MHLFWEDYFWTFRKTSNIAPALSGQNAVCRVFTDISAEGSCDQQRQQQQQEAFPTACVDRHPCSEEKKL